MKKLLILIALLPSSFLLKAQTNVYHHFPDSNAMWIQLQWRSGTFNNYPMQKFWYVQTGDTTISNKLYKKIARRGKIYSKIGHFGLKVENGYIGAIREDTLNKKVFLTLKDSINESLLYDFNLIKGDTLEGLIANESSSPSSIIVQEIDSIKIGDTYRRSIYFGPQASLPSSYGRIIEGVGSSAGLFEPFNFTHADIGGNILICYFDDKNTFHQIYDSPNIWECDTNDLTSVYENTINNTITMHPNPAYNSFFIDIKDITYNKIIVYCYNIFGREVKIDYIIDNNRINVDMSNLSQGVYLISITIDNRLFYNNKLLLINK